MLRRRPVLIKDQFYDSVNAARKALNMPRIKLTSLLDGPNEDYRYLTPDEVQQYLSETEDGRSD